MYGAFEIDILEELAVTPDCEEPMFDSIPWSDLMKLAAQVICDPRLSVGIAICR